MKQALLRRRGRELAVMFLYGREMNTEPPLEEALDDFFDQQEEEPAEMDPIREFAEELIRGVLLHRDQLDQDIVRLVQNWTLDRIAAVDRNLLRLGLYEMRFRDDIPPVVTINEIIEIGKVYGTEESGGFVNGILDRYRAELLRPSRLPAGS
jgi:N utilization substance protein B